MFDQFPTQPDFQIAVTGGSVEENNALTTAIFHSLRMCGFSGLMADPATTLTPGNEQSHDVLNAIFALNPDLFESSIAIAGMTEQDAMLQRAMMLQQNTQAFQMPSFPQTPPKW